MCNSSIRSAFDTASCLWVRLEACEDLTASTSAGEQAGGGGSPGGKTCNYRLLQATSIAMCEVLEQWVAWSIDILEITSQSPACTRFLAAQKLSGRRLEVPEGADAHPEPQSNHPGRAFGAHNVTRGCKRVGPGVAGCSFRPSSTEPSTRSLESGRMEWPVSVSNAELRD